MKSGVLLLGGLMLTVMVSGTARASGGEGHVLEAVQHTQEAIEHGKQGHADVLGKHAEVALQHAEAAQKDMKGNPHI